MVNKQLCWFKGRLMDVQEAKISVLSPTTQYGINVFEGIRGYWNADEKQLFIFRLKDHIERLFRSSKLIKFNINYTIDEITEKVVYICRENNFRDDVVLRVTFFLVGNGNWASNEPVDLFIYGYPKRRYFDIKKGIKCCTSTWLRIEDNIISPRIKAGANYINSRMAQLEAKFHGCDSAILLNKLGKVSEGPGAGIFIVRNGQLVTPPLTSSILESITRDTVIEIAKNELNIPVVEREIDRTELYIADEIFFVGTAVEITPVVNVDGYVIAKDTLGPITKSLQDYYFKIARGQYKRDKYKEWLAPVYI